MRYAFQTPPRRFRVGGLEISDHGKVHLEPWDMISIVRDGGHECDVTATDWGLYLAPSLEGRMLENGYRVALVRNVQGKAFLNAVLVDRLAVFQRYLEEQGSVLVAWLGEAEADECGASPRTDR